MHTPTSIPEGTVFARTACSEVGVDPSVGNLPHLMFHWQGKTLAPLHRAPWVEDSTFPDEMPPVDRKLSGDFVCAPFGMSDVEPSPPHGWSSNSAWSLDSDNAGGLRFTLDKVILGARLTKQLRPAPDAPLLYQVHTVDGGSGGLTFAHHPMMRVAGGARLFTSPKRLAVTPDAPIVEGRHALQNGVATADHTAIPATRGGTIDVTRLPIADGDEDFVALVEAEESELGWTAVIREAFDDIVFVLKDPSVLPLTMLWHSNGGREDAPWSGRHRGVLGIEDGIAAGAAGHKAALGETVFSRAGVPTVLSLAEGKTHRVAHVIGAVPRPVGWEVVADITIDGEALSIHEASGGTLDMPFDPNFFGRPA
ncbi:MAG: hypothetical protein AAF234_10645 [Pseudomonadota bacterium]